MKKFLKKFMAFGLAFTMFLSPTVISANQNGQDLASEEINEYYYIPLRDAFESNGGVVSWNAEDSSVSVAFEGKTYVFHNDTIVENGVNKDLKADLINKNGRLYVYYDDIAFAYETDNEIYKTTKKETVAYIYNMMDSLSVASFSLVFTDNEKNYDWYQSFGYSDIEEDIRPNNETLYNLASISKTFTTIGIMKLVEEGKINLDDKVTKYLPDFKLSENPEMGGNFEDVTLRMLLSHTGGIKSDIYNNFYSANSFNTEYLNSFLKNYTTGYMEREPMKRTIYANAGFTLIGLISAKLTNADLTPFDGFVKYMDGILSGLGFEKSDFVDAPKDANFASPYLNAGLAKKEYNYVNNLPAGGFSGNAKDMQKLLRFFLNKGKIGTTQFLSEASIKEMMTATTVIDQMNSAAKYGLGLYNIEYKGKNMWGHGGNLNNYHSDFRFLLEEQIGAFVTSNTDTAKAATGNITIIMLEAAAVEKTGKPLDDSKTIAKPDYTIKELKEYEGKYLSFGNVVFEEDGFTLAGDLKFKKLEDGTFANELVGTIRFVTIEGIDCILMYDVIVVSFRSEFTIVGEDFTQYVGNYEAKPLNENDRPIITSAAIALDTDNSAILMMAQMDAPALANVGYLLETGENQFITKGEMRNFSQIIEFKNVDGVISFELFGITFVKVS